MVCNLVRLLTQILFDLKSHCVVGDDSPLCEQIARNSRDFSKTLVIHKIQIANFRQIARN